MKFSCKAPQSIEEFNKYYHLRWLILRKPWQQPLGSEQDGLEQQACHRMFVDEKNNILAVSRLHKTSHNQAQIRYMAVDPQYQGMGLGKQLMLSLEVEASQQGVTEITLNARAAAVPFYQRLGYQKLAFSHQLYGDVDHFLMKKLIPIPESHQYKKTSALQALWYKTIPMSKAMNIELCYYDQQSLIAQCDQIFNKNLHNTMFAGSIYTLATLTGWGWVYLQLEQAACEHKNDIVLANGNIRYISPITGFVRAKTTTKLVQSKFNGKHSGKKIRFKVVVEVFNGDQLAANFNGDYVIIPTQ